MKNILALARSTCATRAAFAGVEPLESRIAPAATIFKVTTLKDITDQNHDTGSLRDAIYQANNNPGDSLIEFVDNNGHALHGAIKLTSDLPAIALADASYSLTISGPTSGKANGIILNGQNHQILNITQGNVSMSDFTVTHGQAPLGGGIYIADSGATIQMTDLTISANRAVSTNFEDANGGGIYLKAGTVEMTDSKVLGNWAVGATGSDTHAGGYVNGGGIWAGSDMTIKSSVVSGNVAKGGSALPSSSGQGGAGGYGGGVYVNGDTSANVLIQDSLVSANKVIGGNGSNGHKGATGTAGSQGQNGGQGVYGDNGGWAGGAVGGGVYARTDSTVTVVNSTISGNLVQGGNGGNGGVGGKGGAGGSSYTDSNGFHHAGSGGSGGLGGKGGDAGWGFGGGAYVNGTLTIQNSTISGNTAKSGKAGIGGKGGAAGSGSYTDGSGTHKGVAGASGNAGTSNQAYGGGVLCEGSLDLSQVTVAKNTTGGLGGGVAIVSGDAKIHNSTIAFNKAATAGGFFVKDSVASSSVELISNIIASNSAATSPDIAGAVDASHNLFGVANGGTFDTLANITNPAPKLGSLGMHGGPTATILPASTSPALDAGSDPDSLGTGYDQRGTPFLRLRGAGIDIGAVEFA